MASIFGCLHTGSLDSNEIADKMFQSLAARGGEARKAHLQDGLVIGARADSDSLQGAFVTNETKNIIAAVEGEIYNFEEIKAMLGGGSSAPLETPFDAIPRMFEKFGKDFARHLNGIFAIALWDDRSKTLHLVRDHLGSHSLFYCRKNGNICFSSTLRAILDTGLVQAEISIPALNEYFSATAVCPPHTVLKDILCLRPGSVVTFRDGSLSDEDYWPIKDIEEDYGRGMDDFAEEVRGMILDAVKIRANYGGKYGSLMSGGVDTGIITGTLAGLGGETPLPVFSIAFEEAAYSDAELQKYMYRDFNLIPNTTVLGPGEFSDTLQRSVSSLDVPVNDVAMVGMYKAFAAAKAAGCSAVFDGEAADEIFFTGHAHAEREFLRYTTIPSPVRQFLFGQIFKSIPLESSFSAKLSRLLYRVGLTDDERRMTWLPSFHGHKEKILLDGTLLGAKDPFSMGKNYLHETSLHDPLNIYYYGLLKAFLPDDLLYKNERMAAANGIVNRTPFIDYRLVELGYKIPQKLKIKPRTPTDDGTKLVYKKAIKGLIPEEILNRKKTRGFSQPTSVWYRGELKDFVHNALFSGDSQCHGYLNKKYMHDLYSMHINGVANLDYLLSSLLIFELWLRSLRN